MGEALTRPSILGKLLAAINTVYSQPIFRSTDTLGNSGVDKQSSGDATGLSTMSTSFVCLMTILFDDVLEVTQVRREA